MTSLRALLRCSSLLCATLFASHAFADYRMQPGDVVQIDVAGLPELRQKVPVQQDGTISFPLLGSVSVAGLTVPELQAKVADGLANKIYRRWTAEGREIDIIVRPDEIAASIAEYRPIYVGGQVAKPGELAFKPDMTVRMALDLSGGYDLLSTRSPDLALQATSLRGDGDLYWLDFAKAQARVARVTNELAGKDQLDPPTQAEGPLGVDRLKQIYQLEQKSLTARLAASHDETASLQGAIKQIDDQVAVVTKLQTVDAQGAASDQQDLQRQLQLFSRGMLTSTQVNEARRALLYSSTRTLQATTQLLLLQRQRQDALQQLQKYEDERRISLLKELQDSTMALSEAQAKAANVRERLDDISATRGSDDAGAARVPDISIIRSGEKGSVKLSAQLDTALQPGDLVDVELKSQDFSQAAVR